MRKSSLLEAFQGTNRKIPVWFMRQAGRYLPEYRKIRDKYHLVEMFQNSELASFITCLPVNLLKVDAAILFADILTLPAHLGFDIQFLEPHGPLVKNPIQSFRDILKIHDFEDIPYLRKIIRNVKQRLKNIPLIGFAGAPFTVLCYLVEGGPPQDFSKIKNLARKNPKAFHQMMLILTQATISYIQIQKQSGIDVFQLFDTWAGILAKRDYQQWVLPYVQNIFENIDLPSIYYLKNCFHLLELMVLSKANFLSVCESVDFSKDTILAQSSQGVQGNLLNRLLFSDEMVLEKEINRILQSAKKFPRYIFNLNHGILPETKVNKVKFVVEKVHAFSWRINHE